MNYLIYFENIQNNVYLLQKISFIHNRHHIQRNYNMQYTSDNSINDIQFNTLLQPPKNSPQIFFSTDPEIYGYNKARNVNKNIKIDKTFKSSEQNLQEIIHSNLSGGTSEGGRNSNRNYSKIQQKILSKYKKNRNSKSNFSQRSQNGSNFKQDNINNNNRPSKVKKEDSNGRNNSPIIDSPYAQYFPLQKQVKKQVQPGSQIKIQKSLTKPKFSFNSKADINDDQSLQTQDDLISFQNSSIGSLMSLNGSKSASNFSDVLKIQQQKLKMKVIKNGDLQGYMLSKIDKKEQNINKKLQQIKKNNQIYSNRIKQKQLQIQLVSKRMEKQQKQLKIYQSKLAQAYENYDQNQSSLLISSRNYEVSNQKMEQYVKNKTQIYCNFQGLPKKLCKQIMYGKCMILQTDLLKVGFDNKIKPGVFQLFITIKQNVLQMDVFIDNSKQSGFIINDGFAMKVHNVPANKKIKIKVNLSYDEKLKEKLGFMNLRIVLKLNTNTQFSESTILPFTLYRNYFNDIPSFEKAMPSSGKYTIITQWQNSCDQLIKNPKGYLSSFFKEGVWLSENIYHLDLLFQNNIKKSINIIFNCRNFAIQMIDTKGLDMVTTIGKFLTRVKDKESVNVSYK